jgi:hypothetical protein
LLIQKLEIPSLKLVDAFPIDHLFNAVICRIASSDKTALVLRDNSTAKMQLVQLRPPRVLGERSFTQKNPHGYPVGLISTEATPDGTIFATCDEGRVTAIRFSDGARIWSLNLSDAGPWRALPVSPRASSALILIKEEIKRTRFVLYIALRFGHNFLDVKAGTPVTTAKPIMSWLERAWAWRV